MLARDEPLVKAALTVQSEKRLRDDYTFAVLAIQLVEELRRARESLRDQAEKNPPPYVVITKEQMAELKRSFKKQQQDKVNA